MDWGSDFFWKTVHNSRTTNTSLKVGSIRDIDYSRGMGKGQPKHARKAGTQSRASLEVAPSATAKGADTSILDVATASSTAAGKAAANNATPRNATASNATASEGISPEAQEVVNKLNAVDDRITRLRTARTADPDTALDKLLTMAIPSLAGMIAGKVFSSIWEAGFGTQNTRKTTRRGKAGQGKALAEQGKASANNSLMKDLLFTACSAAFVAVVAQISDKSVRSMIAALQRRRK